MKIAILALLANVNANFLFAPSDSFPGFDSFHAHCEIEVEVMADCADTIKALTAALSVGKNDIA